ncbi:putative histidine kinase HHK19p, partial [Aureobasidium melanogenum]
MEDNNIESTLQLLEKGDASTSTHLQLIRTTNWQQYSVGPISSWPRELSTVLYLVMAASRPQCLVLGEENLLLYNRAYGKMVRDLHPKIFGQPLDSVKEWQGHGAQMAAHRRGAATLRLTHAYPSFVIPMLNQGKLENVHLRLDITTLPPPIEGFHLCFEDTTDHDLRERRRSTVQGRFEYRFHVATSDPNLEPLKQAIVIKDQVIIKRLPEEWAKGSLYRGTHDLCTEAAVLPSSFTKHQDAEALLIIGLPTRTPLDEPHQQHLGQVQSEFAHAVNTLVATMEATYRRKENARQNQLEKDLLAKELALRQKEAEMATTLADKVLTVIDEVDIGFFEYKSTGELVRANECYYRLSGYPRDCPSHVQHKFLDLIYPADVDRVSQAWHSMINGEWQKFELRYRNGTEQGQWALVACQPVKDNDGNVISIIGAVTDISDQKKSEKIALDRAEALEQARVSEERFKRCMEVAPFGCMVADTTKGVQYVNEAWWELSQHARVPLNQIDWNSVLHEDDLEVAEQGWQAMLRGEQVVYSLRLKRLWYDANGEPRGPAELMVTALPECDDTGKVIRVIGFTIDQSHIRHQARMQRARIEEATEARKNQEMFYDTVCHEIRNPLSAVIHCTDSINDNLIEMRKLVNDLASCKMTGLDDDDDKINCLLNHISSSNESVETITHCSEHQRRLISDILSLSKLDSQLLQINPSPTLAMSLLENIRKMFETEAERVGVTLEVVADSSVFENNVEQVNLDSGRILQVLINLVSNAIKFTKNESGPRRIKVTMGASSLRPLDLPVDSFHNQESIYDTVYEGQDEFYLWFTVTDSGRGLSAEEKARIFTRFAQGSRKTYSEYGGSGLGLFISRQLVELMNGQIGVSAELGQGSTFAFFVNAPPVQQIVKVDSSLSHQSKANSGINVSSTGTLEPCTKTTLLVVEDNILNQRVLKKQLIKHGYEVHVASNGQEALDFLVNPTRQVQIDCILMDVVMPVMDGLTAAKRIREWERQGSFVGNNSNGSIKSRPRLSRGSSSSSRGLQ